MVCLLAAGFLLLSTSARAQRLVLPGSSEKASQPEPPKDILGRSTPRGTVLGFLRAEHKGDNEAAVQYLNTRLRGEAAVALAHQLSVVLDRGLSARLSNLSDRPEGSLAFPARPDQDLVGTISGDHGSVDIIVERVDRKESGPVWLFSSKTLDAVPGLYQEATAIPVENVIPEVLVSTRIADIPLFEWLAVFFGMPLLYLSITLASRLLSPLAGSIRRRVFKNAYLPNPELLPIPVRLVLMALIIGWTVPKFALPLLEREFWSATGTVITIAAVVWTLILLNGIIEGFIRRRMVRLGRSGTTAILRLGRRTLDLLLLFAGLLTGLHHFGVNLTGALAGLGVGGIAVALAAQKTLENVIGGISIIFDEVVHVGDRVIVVDREGFVEDIGLRSTRIRTLDRTVLIVPNGQIATVTMENITIRDRFWFHHTLRLRYETPASKMRSILEAVKTFLAREPRVEHGTNWARFRSLGTSSLDVEIYAYVFARELAQFLEIQQELLLAIMEVVQAAGGALAYPSQIVYVTGSQAPGPATEDASPTNRDLQFTRQNRG